METRDDLAKLRKELASSVTLAKAVGAVNPRPPGLHNDLIQRLKGLVGRLLAWYTRPVGEFNSSVLRALDLITNSIEDIQRNQLAIDERLARLEREIPALSSPVRAQTEQSSASETPPGGSGKIIEPDSSPRCMEADWDVRARENPLFYIDTGHCESEEAFEKSGEWDLQFQILDGVGLSPGATVLEIGCGIGRLLKPLASRAAAVIGVDISGEMVRRAQDRLAACPNVRVYKTGGDLTPVATSSVDFCFSYVVFQHFPAKEPILAYFDEARRVLRTGGIFRFQVNQRPEKFAAGHVADTWDGVGLGPDEAAVDLEKAGFRILDAWGEMTHYAWYTAQAVKIDQTKGTEAQVQFNPTPVDPAADREVLARACGELSETTLDALLSNRLAWRAALDFLLARWPETTDEEFVRPVARALLNRELEPRNVRAILSLMQEGRLSRSVFLDGLISSSEFRKVLAGSRG